MHFSFVFVLVIPFAVAYRDGARADSCYDHRIMHTSEGNPPVFKLNCPTSCQYNLTLNGQIDELSLEIIKNATDIDFFYCGATYQCKNNSVRACLYFLHCTVTLTETSDTGFLIQARNGTAEVFNPESSIWGTWLVLDPSQNWHPLHCGMNQANPTPTFPVQ